MYESVGKRGVLDPIEQDWEPARTFFEERKVRIDYVPGPWGGWSHELDGVSEFSSYIYCMHILNV
jgi:hypothetical protein